MPNRPDIILLILDTQRADRLSCYGYQHGTSPAIDALANHSTRYAAGVAPAQWTVPTHASIFTGLYPSQHTMHQMNSVLPGSLQTLAQRLAGAGYYTAGFSQNPHIGLVKNDLDRGFQRFESHHLLSNILLTTRLNQPETPPPLRKRLERGMRWLLAESLGYSYETPLQRLTPLLAPLWQRFLHFQGRSKTASTARMLATASRLLQTREGCAPDQPIFIFLNLMGAHVPYDPDRRFLDRFLPQSYDRSQIGGLLRWANQLQIDVNNWIDHPLTRQEQTLLNAIYDAEVATQDAQVGAFLDSLRDRDQLDRTYLAIAADHGDHLGDKDRVNHAFGVYEALVHVPLIVHDPAQHLPAGTVRHEPVSTCRLFHTLLAAAGVATEEEVALSLAQAPEPSAVSTNEGIAVYSEGFPLEWAVGRLADEKRLQVEGQGATQTVRAVRHGALKLISGSGCRALYDLSRDGDETEDLHAILIQRTRELQQSLDEFVTWAQPVARAVTREEDDAEVLRQLRDLGYIE